jgi:hypothetical protein
MANTKLILTPENKNYLTAFLADYLIKCSEDINPTAKSKLVELINILVPEN